jgi:hypothetical protein
MRRPQENRGTGCSPQVHLSAVQLSFPTRISPALAFGFALISLLVQQVQHTDPVFSALYFAFVVLSALAFNLAGGFSRVAGAYYCWFSLLVVIVGVTTKLFLGEPGDSNLLAPELTMTCYVVSAGMFLLVATILKRFDLRPFQFGAGGRSASLNYTAAGLGCIITTTLIGQAGALFGIAPGGLLSALHQLDQFLPLGIILATIGAINDSDGKIAFNFVNTAGMVIFFANGLISFSKQGMITPFVCWLVGATYMRFKLRPSHLLGIIFFSFMSFFVFSPLSQSRDLIKEDMSTSDRLFLGIDSIIHIQRVREHVKAYGDDPPSHSYFSTAQNALVSRLTMIGVDDALINYGALSQPLGWGPVEDDFLNFLPHVIAPNKAEVLTGNYYAHEIGGMVANDDTSTGISFSPVSEAFRGNQWIGLFIILPGVWLILFSLTEFVCGDVRTSPWSLLPMLMFSHVAPEGLLSGQIYMIAYGNGAFLLAILFCTRVAPTLGRLFYGSAVASTKVAGPGVNAQPRRTASSGSPAAALR